MVLFMNKWRNLPLRNTVLILFHHRHLLNSWRCRRAKTDFILLNSFLYSMSSMSDTFQPSSVPVYRSHFFLKLGIFWFISSLSLPFLYNLFRILRCAIVIVMSWVSPDGRVSQTSLMSLCTAVESYTSAMKVLKGILTLPHQNDMLDSPN
jgi:hypothetical protein